MQRLMLPDGMMLEVKRSFAIGQNQMIHELPSGAFVYMDGKPVTERSVLSGLPKPHRENAAAWFESTYGKKVKSADVEVKTMAKKFEEKPKAKTVKSEVTGGKNIGVDTSDIGEDEEMVK